MKTVAENCTGLWVLNFEGALVTAENLAALIASDPSQTRDIHADDHHKRCKPRLPPCLESLSFKQCTGLTGPSCLEIVSLLGPQLKHLSLQGFKDISDQHMMDLVKRCPNLVGLQLTGTLITDEFLKSVTQELQPSAATSSSESRRQHLRDLKLDLSKQVSSGGIIPVVLACRSSLRTLSVQYMKSVGDELLFALVKDPLDKKAIERGPTFGPETLIMQHRFSLNTVLTELRL
ncbi:unnamed protein product [Mortierella alpina]